MYAVLGAILIGLAGLFNLRSRGEARS
jgi:hypothetical protein